MDRVKCQELVSAFFFLNIDQTWYLTTEDISILDPLDRLLDETFTALVTQFLWPHRDQGWVAEEPLDRDRKG